MKKVLLTCIVLFAWCVQTVGQKYLNFYQDDTVIFKILASEVDSINVTETDPYTINLWHEGTVFQSYATEEVDSVIVTDERGEPLSYLGIVGFNSGLYTKRVGLLSQSTVSQYESFINNLPKKDGTILYYAVDSALNVMEGANIKTQLSSVNFITFTDGLDQGSIMLNPKYNVSNNYLQDVSKRISEAQAEGLSVNAYTIGLRGKDVTDVDMFKRNLNSLATSKDKAFEVSDISELRSRLQEIANKIICINTRQTISVKIPGIDNGTTIRFTFDGNDANNSQLFIEGTLNLLDYSLHDVTYHGIKARTGSIVQGTQDGIFLTFTFTGMRREDESGTLNTNYVKHFYRIPSSTTWQVNSELTPTNNIQRNVSYLGTSIILVLDCSSSLGSDFSNMQSYATEFIDMVARNAMPYKYEAPQNVQAVLDSADLAIHVKWDSIRYTNYYQVYRSNNGSYYSNYELVADSVISTSWKDNAPMSGNNYYKVCAVGLGLTSEKSNSSNSLYCSLEAPRNVSGDLSLNGNSLAIRIMWDAVKYADYYKIYRSNNYRNGYELMADSVVSNTWMDESPLPDKNFYKVIAVSQAITSSESNYCEVKCILGVPQNVNAVQDSVKMAIHVTWDKVNLAQWYKIYRSNSYNSNYELVADSVTSTSWKDNAPMSGYNYYKVCAVGLGLTSEKSNSSNSLYCSLEAPRNVSGDLSLNGNSLAIRIMWDAVKYADYYKIYRSNNYRNGYELMADSVFSTTWIDESPLPDKNFYKVIAVSQAITSFESNYCEAKCILGVPQNVNAVQDSVKMAIHVTWDKVNLAQWYKIYRSNSYNSNYELVADSVTSTSWKDNAPMSGNNYYKVCAVGLGLTSEKSNSSNSLYCSLEAPRNISGDLSLNSNSLAIRIMWDAVKYADYYKIYRSNNYRNGYELMADSVVSNTWMDESPLPDKNFYKVIAVSQAITSSESNYCEVKYVMDAPENVIGELTLKDNILAVEVSWNALNVAETYCVYRSNSSNGTYSLIAENIKVANWIDNTPLVGNNYYKVSASGYGLKSSQSSASNVVNVALAVPKNVKGELVLSSNKLVANIMWDAVQFAENYNIYRSSSSNGTYSMIAENIRVTNWIDNTPLVGNNYYKVSASGYGLKSAQSSASNVVNVALTAPKNVKGELVLSGNRFVANITWDAVNFAETYSIYRCKSSGGTYSMIAENIKATNWTDRMPLEGNNYYKVSATGYGLNSSQSSASNVVNVALTAPNNVKGELVLSGNKLAVNLTWDVVQFAQSYNVYRSSSTRSDSFMLVAEDVIATSWKDNAPLENNNYYRVSAVGYGLNSPVSSTSNVVKNMLEAPKNVKAELVLSDNNPVANITWDTVQFAQSYTVYRSSSSNGTYTLLAENISSTAWRDKSPQNGNNYYKVAASGYGLTSSISSASNVVTR